MEKQPTRIDSGESDGCHRGAGTRIVQDLLGFTYFHGDFNSIVWSISGSSFTGVTLLAMALGTYKGTIRINSLQVVLTCLFALLDSLIRQVMVIFVRVRVHGLKDVIWCRMRCSVERLKEEKFDKTLLKYEKKRKSSDSKKIEEETFFEKLLKYEKKRVN